MSADDDLLTRATDHAAKVLPEQVARLLVSQIKHTRSHGYAEKIAREILSMPALSPTVDREALADLFRAAPGNVRLGDQTPGEIADTLLARYDIRERGEQHGR